MESLSSFAIGLAVNTVYGLITSNIKSSLKKEIVSAFENSLNRWSTNKSIREQKRTELKEYIEENFNNGNELHLNELPQEIKDFFTLFNEELCLVQPAYNFLKEINDKKRYDDLKKDIKSISENFQAYIAINSKENEQIKDLLKTSLHQEWSDQIKIYQNLLEEFKPLTALNLVESLNSRLAENQLESNPILQSKVEYLKALCLEQVSEKRKESYQGFIKAFELNSNNSIYKERACLAYYMIEDFINAKKLIEELLITDSLNEIANAVSILLNIEEFENKINPVSKLVKRSPNFRRILYVNLRNQPNIGELCNLFPELIYRDEELKLFDLSYPNFKNNTYIVEITINKFLREFKIEFIETESLNKSALESILNILNTFLGSVEGTEIQKDYRHIEFFSRYIEYSLHRKTEDVFKLKQCYDSLNNTVNEVISIIMANVLQKDNQDKEAIALLKKIKPESQNVLNLTMYCAQKSGETDLIIETANKINQNVTEINSIGIIDFLRIIRLLGHHQKLESFDFELLKSKSFKIPEYLQFIKIYYSLWTEGDKVDLLEKINAIKDILLNRNKTFSTYIQEAYFKNKNYKESADIFSDNDNSFKHPLDISHYIDALNILKSNNKDLLKWLEYWRVNIDFDPRFARMEIEKVALISDWKRCEIVCENAINHDKHEDFLLYLGISLYHNDDQDKLDSYIEDITEHDYQKVDIVIQIIHILFHFNYHKEGLELCYLWAKEKGNKQARTLFFTSFMHTSLDHFIEFKEVAKDHYVRYTLNNDSQAFTQKIEDDDFSKQLIGHVVNDKIEVKRTYGNKSDIVHIKFICNKYLALKLEIIEEVKNPQSGLGMQSFKIPENESIIDVISEIVPPIDNPEKPYEQYYSNEIKFSQLPFFPNELKTNFIITYYKLVYEKKGLLKVPNNLFPFFEASKDYQFILDFTSLLFLFELSKENKFNPDVKFNISNFMLDLIKSYEDDSLNYIQHKEYCLNDKFYSELTEWIKTNCNVITPVQLLDIIGDRKIKKDIPLSLYLLNEIAILQEIPNSILITDDLTFYQLYPIAEKKLMSTDYYLLFSTLNKNL